MALDKKTEEGLRGMVKILQSDDHKHELNRLRAVYDKDGYDAALKLFDGAYKSVLDRWETEK